MAKLISFNFNYSVTIIVLFVVLLHIEKQVLTDWVDCKSICEKKNTIPDWYRSFFGINKCVCIQSDFDSLTNESKLLTVHDNPMICSDAGASCESCCKNHLGLPDWEKSFTDRRPDLCLCKVNPDNIFTPTDKPESRSAKLKSYKQQDINQKDNYNINQKQPCRKAGPSCDFCCRKNSEVVDWNKSFKGNYECICKIKV